jgi:hypothetical protein
MITSTAIWVLAVNLYTKSSPVLIGGFARLCWQLARHKNENSVPIWYICAMFQLLAGHGRA